jgi:glycosyltransferase involved in cell wall biosynthesis
VSAPRVLAIVPAKDEAENLPATLAELAREAPWAHVLVVDDGSTDATSDVARRHGATVLRHAVNLGVGGALQTGFRWALDHGFDVAVQFDADGQHPAAALGDVVAPVAAGEVDVCIGSRFVSRTAYHAPFSRRLGMWLFSGVVRAAVGRRIADTTSGLRAYGRGVLEAFAYDLPADFPDAPLLIAIARAGFRLGEVPVEMRERRAGRSFYTLGRQLGYPYKNLLASAMALIQRHHPR